MKKNILGIIAMLFLCVLFIGTAFSLPTEKEIFSWKIVKPLQLDNGVTITPNMQIASRFMWRNTSNPLSIYNQIDSVTVDNGFVVITNRGIFPKINDGQYAMTATTFLLPNTHESNASSETLFMIKNGKQYFNIIAPSKPGAPIPN